VTGPTAADPAPGAGTGTGGAVPTIEPADLVTRFGRPGRRGEIALLDAREEGAFASGHPFPAASAPLSQLELVLDGLVPRRSTPVVWYDDGVGRTGDPPGPAHRAAAVAARLGWTSGAVLAGGTTAWVEAGHHLYAGLGVPATMLAARVRQGSEIPSVSPVELAARLERDDDLVVVDTRPAAQFRRRSIPRSVNRPGVELVHRVAEVAPGRDTAVVVTGAARTGGIIGARSLIEAGVANPVLVLDTGVLGWELAGLELASGIEIPAPELGHDARSRARSAAAAVADRFAVPTVEPDTVRTWLADPDRTTHLFDVRTRAEYEAGHLAGAAHAPGGTLVETTDRSVATSGSRLVLIDDDGVRATATASWLSRLGWETFVLASGASGERAAAAGWSLTTGSMPRPEQARSVVPVIRPPALQQRLDGGEPVTVIDIGTSTKYRRRGHLPGAWWGVRGRLGDARRVIGEATTVVLTSTDGTLAKLAVAEAAAHWPRAEVLALAAGNKGWRHAGLDMEPGFDRATTTADDVWYLPHDHPVPDGGDGAALLAERIEAHLAWEADLIDRAGPGHRDPLTAPLDLAG
jgi:rhodanese-related sulfurtransferase